jgi:hypothetical protein
MRPAEVQTPTEEQVRTIIGSTCHSGVVENCRGPNFQTLTEEQGRIYMTEVYALSQQQGQTHSGAGVTTLQSLSYRFWCEPTGPFSYKSR